MAIFSAIAGYLTIALGNLGLSIAAASVVANIAVGAALIGISALASGIGRSTPTTSTPQAQATLNQSTGPRIRGYGRAKLGGTRAFWDSTNAILYQIVMAHHGRVDAFEQFYVGDIAVARNPVDGMVTTPPLNGYVQINEAFGSDDQTSHGGMMTAWPDVWTADHRLRGIANWFVRFYSPAAEVFQSVFPEGYNTQVRCVCRLSHVWDPRDVLQDPDDETTWAWSDNAALCILDYLTHPDGYGLNRDDVDIDSFIAKADIDDEAVALAAGGTEPRYRLWGVYSLTDDPHDVLSKMRAACDAELYQTPEGKIAIRGGVWKAPTVTIRDQDILAHSMEQGNNRFSAFNDLKIVHTSPDHDYQSMEVTAWEDLADQADRGVLTSSLHLDMVPSPTQARRLAKIHIAKANSAWKGTISANLSALDALGERTIRLVLPELGIDDAFFVAGFSIRSDLTGVDMSVMSISETAYSWLTTEESEAAPKPDDTRPDLTFPIPEGLTLTKDGNVITAEVDEPNRTDLQLQVQYRAGAGSIWQDMEVDPGQSYQGFTPTLPDGDYQARARWLGPLETAGDWTSPLAEITLP